MAEISVVIPTKDREQRLRKTLPIFLAQPEVAEVVIVIDGCSDGTLNYAQQMASADKRIRIVDNVANKGLPYSRNRGIDAAECEFIFTGEDDLEVTDGFFGLLLAHMRESGADIISGRNIFQGPRESAEDAIVRADKIQGPAVNSRTLSVYTSIKASGDQEQAMLPAPMLGRTEVFRKVRFDDQYRGNAWREESDFQFSAYEAGFKLVYCPHALTFNVQTENDRGGVHATWGLKRAAWTIRNNWRFVRKHKTLIAQEFRAGEPRIYMTRFAVHLFVFGMLLPQAVEVKRRFFPNPWLRDTEW